MLCYYCNTEKESELFRRTTGTKLQCKACYSSYIANYIKTRPEKVAKNREYVKRSRPRRRSERKAFTDWLKSVPCTDCGLTYHPEAMDFDHIQDGPKGGWKEAIAHQIARTKTQDDLMSKIQQCEVVCANCHRIRTVKRRIGTEAYEQQLSRP